MPPNRVPDFFNLLSEQIGSSINTQPLILGGSSGPGGGGGTPAGGFVGKLRQSQVTYDTTEAALSATGSSPSLVDNLNHIRYRLTQLESGSGSGGGGSGSSGQIKVSSLDTTLDYLQSKLVAGTGITLTKNNPGGNETLTVAAHAAVTLDSNVDVLLGLSTQQLTLDSQNPNKVFAGPASGSAAGPPTFRSLVADDLGTGAAGAGKYLRGDLTWQDTSGLGGSGSSGNRYFGAYNYADGSGVYRIGTAVSPDGRTWTRKAEPQIDLGSSGAWDDFAVKDPWLVKVDGVLYLYYSGNDSAVYKIGLARSFDSGLTWTKYASNPILSPTQAWENNVNNEVHRPVVLYDPDETNASKRWKMWYAGGEFGAGGVGYAYSADGLSWTKYASNPVLTKGAGGTWDDSLVLPGPVIRRGTVFVMFYNGNDGAGTWKGGVATFSTPESTYTKSASNPVLVSDGKTTTLSSGVNLGDVQVTVADATLFPLGAPVWVYSTSGGTRYLSTVKKRISSTVLELTDAAPTAVSATGGNVRSAAYNSVYFTAAFYDDGWLFTFTGFQPGGVTGLREVAMLAYTSTLSVVSMDYGAGVLVPISASESTGADASRENLNYIDTWDTSRRQAAPDPDSLLDEKAKVSTNDTTAGYLNGKLVAGSNVTLTENNDGGNETLTIASGSAAGGGGYTQGAHAYHSTTQTVNHDTTTALAFNSERYDTDTIHDNSTNNSRLTCKTAGKYLIWANIGMDADSNGNRQLFLKLNNTTYIALNGAGLSYSSTNNLYLTVSTVYDLAVNDYVEVVVYQNSGGTRTIQANSNFSPEFAMQRIG